MDIKNVIVFTLGFAVGAVGATLYLKDRYAQIAQEEIDSVKEEFKAMQDDSEKKNETKEAVSRRYEEKPDIKEYAREVESHGYVDYSGVSQKKPEKGECSDPYVIEPEEFSNDGTYEAIDLTYYANGVVCDDMDEPLENQDDIVGTDFMNHFGEYGEDIVHIRNDRLKADYEITYVHSDYIAE